MASLKLTRETILEHPRENSNHDTTLLCLDRRFRLGPVPLGWNGTQDPEIMLERHLMHCGLNEKDILAVPIYLKPNGVTVDIFDDEEWGDDGIHLSGWIYLEKRVIRNRYRVQRIGRRIESTERQKMVAEINELDGYFNRRIYSYELLDDDGDECATGTMVYAKNLEELCEEINSYSSYVFEEFLESDDVRKVWNSLH